MSDFLHFRRLDTLCAKDLAVDPPHHTPFVTTSCVMSTVNATASPGRLAPGRGPPWLLTTSDGRLAPGRGPPWLLTTSAPGPTKV
eukprot:CAMPEP_0175910390 /NCGR_PEP_ID=MMETSP0108-20121206/7643_1 /TAXON_ID=195067 ORGANISM="Goniomonas pacifica, Strain CCMP1869" /NCGR_SAMPLE_ID=MMETSP0108 /ASSEMBLY_ACC=CAM_ASM_000204 /LENGTH=84 /DNA_ID=CAMNT_0017232583 /DNA_START=222 /DNA_END=477 /DNA_ORIENTATION=+